MTGGVYTRAWKAESSVFNGREPDNQRYDFDLDRLDSYSGRFWWLPTSQMALQVSAGHLTETESRPDGSRENINRLTASATYHRLVNDRRRRRPSRGGRTAKRIIRPPHSRSKRPRTSRGPIRYSPGPIS